MERYEKYKDSGVEWIGEIPEGWGVKKIKHRCYVKGRVGWKGLKSSEFLLDGFSYLVTGTDFKDGKVNWKGCYHIDKERYEEDPFIQLQDHDLLITKDGTIGKLAIVDDLDKPACLNSGIFVVRSINEDFTTRYLYWMLTSDIFTKFNEYTSYGSTIQHLYQNVFVEFAFSFPSRLVQTAIANYLDRKAAEIDELIAQKERLLELYEEEKTAIINQAVTKGIDPDVKLKDSGIDWLGEIPEGWEVKKLKYVAKAVITGKTPSSSNAEFYNGDVNWFAPGDFNFGLELTDSKKKITNYAVEKSGMKVFPKHSILLVGIGATVGKMGIAKCSGTSNQQINAIIVKEDQLNPYFALCFLLSVKAAIIRLANAATLPIFNQTQTKEFEIFIPEIAEQTAIVHHIETETTRINAKIAKTKKIIALQKEYRTALISEVVTGKIKVTQEAAS